MGWAADIDKAADKLKVGVSTMVRLISLYIFRGVVLKTPVDQGYLRAAWNISLNEPKFITTPGEKGSSELSENLGFFPRVYITNGLPYAAVVEYGLYRGLGPKTREGSNPTTGGGIFSSQAPVGMVEVTLNDVAYNLKAIVNGN
jgi:hypothetical protein